MKRSEQFELVKLTARYLQETKPQCCKNYRVLMQEPLFRGINYGLSELGITPEEIEQEICQNILKITLPTSLSPSHSISQQPAKPSVAQYDRYLPHLTKFRPEKVKGLPADVRSSVWQLWIAQQIGAALVREREFDQIMRESMTRANEKVLKEAKQEVRQNENPGSVQ
jgi:hypothetical protein